MAKKYPIGVYLFLSVFCVLWGVRAQQESGDNTAQQRPNDSEGSGEDDTTSDTPVSDVEDTAVADDEDEDDALEEDEDEEEQEEEEQDEGEAPLELEGPAAVDLDMSALGAIDPEKELTAGAETKTGETEAAAVADWTQRELDLLEIHGYFRVRPELYDNFNIRGDDAIYDRTQEWQVDDTTDPIDNDPTDPADNAYYLGEDCGDGSVRKSCDNSTRAGANMRLRVEPTLNVSEEVWIKSQIDFLDNVMLGATPRFWQNHGNNVQDSDLIETGRIYGWNMGPPDPSQMIVVRRAWGEVMTPFGQLRFGRMGDHFGLGMLHNAGNGLNQDYGDSVDRIMFATKINDWMIAPAFDFPNEGVSAVDASGRPFDVAQLDDAYQLTGIIGYKHDPEEQAAMLKRGDWVINAGLYFTYRWQVLSFEVDPDEDTTAAPEADDKLHFFRRSMWAMTPDFWLQIMRDTFRLELEVAVVYGEIGNPDRNLPNYEAAQKLDLLQTGAVIQAEYGLLSNQLRFGLEFAYAGGDKNVEGIRAPATYDQPNGDSNTYTAFAFNPAYNTDLILYRHILGSVSQSYYFKFWLQFDFLQNALGRQMGIGANVLYSRAVAAQSTINNQSSNLGVEVDIQAIYRTEDNFFAGVKYGVLFPLAGFKGDYFPPPDPQNPDVIIEPLNDTDLSIPQTVQAMLGISF
ncbi:MAG: TIGR04551 family protein [Myxococcota bacterium]|nr:TIGR04551 family protein [Myxococcota bacterium]